MAKYKTMTTNYMETQCTPNKLYTLNATPANRMQQQTTNVEFSARVLHRKVIFIECVDRLTLFDSFVVASFTLQKRQTLAELIFQPPITKRNVLPPQAKLNEMNIHRIRDTIRPNQRSTNFFRLPQRIFLFADAAPFVVVVAALIIFFAHLHCTQRLVYSN